MYFEEGVMLVRDEVEEDTDDDVDDSTPQPTGKPYGVSCLLQQIAGGVYPCRGIGEVLDRTSFTFCGLHKLSLPSGSQVPEDF